MAESRRAGRVLVVGSLNADLVTRVARLPGPGETVLGSDFAVVAGGKGANQAVAAARAGAAVKMVGRVGADAFGALLREELAVAGVDIGEVSVDRKLPTGTAQIVVDAAGRNQIAVAPGANAAVQPPAAIDADVVVLQLEIGLETDASTVAAAAELGIPVILNAAPARPIPEAMLAELAWLIVNESEAAQLAGVPVDDLERAHRAARALRRAEQGIVVTLGGVGALLLGDAGAFHQTAPRVEVVDTVAAGDAFVGVFAAALARGEEQTAALALAVAAGSLACTRAGAIPSLPSAEAIAASRASLPDCERLAPP